jgi:CubicO group peptidase (beta-lactamase class C family)
MEQIIARLAFLDASPAAVPSVWARSANLVSTGKPAADGSDLRRCCARGGRSRYSPVRALILLLFCIQVFPLANAAAQSAPARTKSQPSFPGRFWSPVPSQKRAGWSKEKLAAAHQYADSIHSAAVMIVKGGEVVDQWGDIDRKITSYSVRKSLISALYGIYSAEGVIDINQSLEQLGTDDSPDPLTNSERQARVVDLLRARSGVYHPVDFETDLMKKNRPARGSHLPGTFWYYNNWDFNTLGTIFEKKTGLKIGEAFNERIAKPIGMQDFQPGDVYYLGGPVSVHSAYMFEITARDLARFGLLYLRHGRWRETQIVPEAWIEKSTHADEMLKVNGVEVGGYEYLWWVEYGGVHFPEATISGMYSARGAGGHYLLVVPSLDLVIVHRADNEPPAKDPKTVAEVANREFISKAQFGHLVRLILDAQTGH